MNFPGQHVYCVGVQVSINKEFDQFISEQASSKQLGSVDNYINELISREVRKEALGWDWLREQISPGMEAAPEEFKSVSAEDVIARNQQ